MLQAARLESCQFGINAFFRPCLPQTYVCIECPHGHNTTPCLHALPFASPVVLFRVALGYPGQLAAVVVNAPGCAPPGV